MATTYQLSYVLLDSFICLVPSPCHSKASDNKSAKCSDDEADEIGKHLLFSYPTMNVATPDQVDAEIDATVLMAPVLPIHAWQVLAPVRKRNAISLDG